MGPPQLALRGPLAGAVAECPFGVGVVDVLQKEQFVARAVRGEAAVGVFREGGFAFPDRQQALERRLGVTGGELQDLRAGRAAVNILLCERGIS